MEKRLTEKTKLLEEAAEAIKPFASRMPYGMISMEQVERLCAFHEKLLIGLKEMGIS